MSRRRLLSTGYPPSFFESSSPSTGSASGLQRQVLCLYRKFLRLAASSPPPRNQELTAFVKHEFRVNAVAVKKSDFRRIEYLLRSGEKQLKTYSKMPISGIRLVQTL